MQRAKFVLYLDFDGVLHDEDVWWHPRRGIFVNTPGRTLFEWMPILEELLAPYPEVCVVLSTSWVRARSFDYAKGQLSQALRQRVIGATFHRREMNKLSFAELPRGIQVMGDVGRRKPLEWVAIDDVDDGWPDAVRGNVVLTNPRLGLHEVRAQTELKGILERMFATRNVKPRLAMKSHRPIIFLDMDEVLCISEEHNSVQMMMCYRRNEMDWPELWAGLVDAEAAANLRRLHDEFNPLYVVSSSWATYLPREQMCDVFVRTGLGFVPENLHHAWVTPRGRSTARFDEIDFWLAEFRIHAQAFLVIDDTMSGWSLVDSPLERDGHVVYCEPAKGFTADRLEQARAKLRSQLIGNEEIDKPGGW